MKSVQNIQYKCFIDLLKEFRIKKGLSQEQLGELIGKRQTFISKVELSERNVNIIDLRQILQGLNISLIEFITELEKRLNEMK